MKIVHPVLFFLCIISVGLNAQNKNIKILSKGDLVGDWQRDTKLVGSGMNQHIHFFRNGDFHMELGNDGDDLRTVTELTGRYRLNNDSLFFTITSKTILQGGDITTSDSGIEINIFSIENGKSVQVKVPNVKEIKEPCYITVISSDHIKINNEVYFKVSSAN